MPRIVELPEGEEIQDGDLFIVSQDGLARKVNWNAIFSKFTSMFGGAATQNVPDGMLKGTGGSFATAVPAVDYPGLNTANLFSQLQTLPVRDKGGQVCNVRAYGARGDGVTDDTLAIQSVIDLFSNQQVSGQIHFPTGVYRTTAPIVYRGLYSSAIRISGEVSSSGMSGAYLMYDGTTGPHAVLEIAGGVDCVIEHLGIDVGPGLAQYGIYAHWDPTRTTNGIGVNHLTLDHVVVAGRGVRTGSACLSIGVDFAGTPDGHQCDDIQILSCKLVEAERGIIIGSGNVKNFFINRTGFWFANYGIDFGVGGSGSGVCSIRDCNFLWNVISDARLGIGNLNMDSCQSEGSGGMLVNHGNSGNPATARIVGCSWTSKALATDDTIIKFQGALYLQGNQLINGRTATSVPAVRLDWSADQPSTVVSEQNYYENAAADYTNGAGAPVMTEGHGWDIWSVPACQPSVRCWGDYGGKPGSIVHLTARGG